MRQRGQHQRQEGGGRRRRSEQWQRGQHQRQEGAADGGGAGNGNAGNTNGRRVAADGAGMPKDQEEVLRNKMGLRNHFFETRLVYSLRHGEEAGRQEE